MSNTDAQEMTVISDAQFKRAESFSLLSRTAVPNPFTKDHRFTCWSITKMIIVGLTLFPIRLIAFILALFFVGLPFGLLASINMPPHDKPTGPCRRALLLPVRLACRILLWCHGVWWITVKDERRPGDTSCGLVIANHTALIDAVFMVWFFGAGAVAKASVRNWPVFGRVGYALRCIFVERQSQESRHKTAQEIKFRAEHFGAGWKPLVIFPEGTTVNGKVMISFKLGAFAPGKAVQPVLLDYKHKNWNPATVKYSTLTNVLTTILQVYNRMEVTLLPVYHPSSHEQENIPLFAANVRALMAGNLGVPLTRHSYEDMFLAATARKQGIDQNFEMEMVNKLTSLTYKEVSELMKQFSSGKEQELGTQTDEKRHRHKSHSPKPGIVTYSDFCVRLGLDAASARSSALFKFFDVDETGTINFVEFLSGMLLVSGNSPFSIDKQIELAFLIYDSNADGKIHVDEMTSVLARAGLLTPTMDGSLTSLVDEDGCIAFPQFKQLIQEKPELLQTPLQLAGQRLQEGGIQTTDSVAIPVGPTPTPATSLQQIQQA
eukprot:TRINITY_DN103048_c0_g1_i1.p1 TRINITY_DN103048_c0_g1~~TRINITY_DN103048_c0_g1_i1.p1  ORF type:complete len:547 (+),score=39.40 TRINITY_DN103048_c0_g1_i1:52-1692(+)